MSAAVSLDGRPLFSRLYAAENGRIRTSFRLKNPSLWSPDSPVLYELTVSFGEDTQRIPFGIRTMAMDADRGFFLNGKHCLLEGVNVHQDHGGWGDAVTRAGIARDLKLIKDAGFNFVRGPHYPKHRFFARECDRLGLLFWSEAPFWGIGGYGDDGYWNASSVPSDPETFSQFEQNCMQAVREMILANRNSPSVMAWSMGNEIFFCGDAQLEQARALATRLTDYAKRLDPTRAAGLGGTQRGGLHRIGDVTGFNGDGATLFRHPPIPNLVSEYGSVQSGRPGAGGLRYTPDTGGEVPPWRMGRALWCAFHHGSIAGIGNMGFIDLYRVPLRSYYDYRERLTGAAPPPDTRRGKAAAIVLTADRTRIGTDGTDDAFLYAAYVGTKGQRVRCKAPITLSVVKGAACFPTGRTWGMRPENGSLADGSGAIELRAYSRGEIIIRASADGMDPVHLSITAEGGIHSAVHYPAVSGSQSGKKQKTDLLRGRPVQVSSELPGYVRSHANDGDPSTCWRPENYHRQSFWTADMESMRTIGDVELEISGAACRIRIDVSPDGKRWKTVCCPLLPQPCGKRCLRLKAHAPAWFIRLRLTGKNYRLCRFSAYEK